MAPTAATVPLRRPRPVVPHDDDLVWQLDGLQKGDLAPHGRRLAEGVAASAAQADERPYAGRVCARQQRARTRGA
eukprot:4543310-Prymnesium_polylepis.2